MSAYDQHNVHKRAWEGDETDCPLGYCVDDYEKYMKIYKGNHEKTMKKLDKRNRTGATDGYNIVDVAFGAFWVAVVCVWCVVLGGAF